jgi:hypothetical protein
LSPRALLVEPDVERLRPLVEARVELCRPRLAAGLLLGPDFFDLPEPEPPDLVAIESPPLAVELAIAFAG